ncbi:hypothetical protein ACRTC9_21660 [Vibrio vulnificus]|uniref:hypothetical protein n=1 Tax=Vibrio vulnificus TaxID=672 RepID=UPI001029FBF0|nr:hypothetical protein [Vibrio vulnificus]ELA3113565.1 hypothetical protein [Vibrio vulnificus]ELB7531403.1 hypothetical protein [Vibrio vulnificus]ELK2279496.1 hypothetical protein [Vibrio vulnificus]MCA3971203.1 hypothetical protein [Vibrio vulnificus]MCU8483536.1 hypothetical protein [Vibrio vulnificus]
MIKELIPLITSVTALVISLYNLYVANFRRRDSLVGSLLGCGMSRTRDTVYEYSLSNTGDNQLVVKEVLLLCGSAIIKSEVKNIPVVLKPGEIVLVDVLFNNKDCEEEGSDSEIVEFGVISSTGKAYRLPHVHKGKGVSKEGIWKAFKLGKRHEGF